MAPWLWIQPYGGAKIAIYNLEKLNKNIIFSYALSLKLNVSVIMSKMSPTLKNCKYNIV